MRDGWQRLRIPPAGGRNGRDVELSPRMVDGIGDLHLARLNKERGRRASFKDATLRALEVRGLAAWSTAPGTAANRDEVLWSLTPEGRSVAKLV